MAFETHEIISKTVLAVDTTSVQFNEIPDTYRDLFFQVYGPIGAISGETLTLQFNGDTGANYAYGYMSASDTTTAVQHAHAVNQTSILLYRGNANSDNSVLEVWIIDYKNTNKWKSTLQRFTNKGNNVTLGGGRLESNAAISSLTLGVDSGAIGAGVSIELWGVGE